MKKIGVCLFTFVSINVIGQNNSDTALSKIELNEVVISVNRFEENKKTIAQQVQVITKEDIANAQSQSTADLISQTGNISVQKSQLGGGSPVIRGFEASRVLLVVDGIRMNNLIYRTGHLQNIVTTDNNAFERIEIIYGPSSTVYGSDALGGVIHLYTKSPLLALDEQLSNIKINAFSRYSNAYSEMTQHIDFNYGNKKFGSLTSFTYSKFGDLMGGKNQNPFYNKAYGERPYYVDYINGKDTLLKNNNRFLQVGSGYSQYDFMQKFLFEQSVHLSHSLNIQYSNSTNVPRYDRLTDPSASTGLRSSEWYYGPQERLLAIYGLNYKDTESIFQNTRFNLSYQKVDESRHDRRFGNKFRNSRIENVDVIGANIDLNRVTTKHNIRFGADVQLNMLQSTAYKTNIIVDTTGKLDTRYPDGDNNMNNYALYFSHSWKLSESLYLNDGIRLGYSTMKSTLIDTSILFHLPYTTVEQKTPVYSGNVGLVHAPSDDLKFSLMLSTGFRVPNIDDMSKIFSSVPGMLIVPNVDLKPEQTINYELGITKISNNKIKWENFIYYTQFINAIVSDKFKYNGQDSVMYEGIISQVYANQNKGEAYLYGFSSNLKNKVNDNLTFALVANYTYGRIKTDSIDQPLDHIPPFMSRFQIVYTYKKFSADFFVNYNGWKILKNYSTSGEDNAQYATPDGMPAWFTTNLHASYKLHKMIQLQTGIDNIFDTQYRTFASGINAPGRNIFITLRFNY